MRIGLEDIDPHIAREALKRLSAPPADFLQEDIHWGGPFPIKFDWQFHAGKSMIRRKRPPTDDEKSAHEIRKKREEHFGLRVAAVPFSGLTLSSLTFLATHAVVGNATAIVMSASTLAVAAVGGGYWAARATPKARLQRAIAPVEMRAVFPLLSLTRAERIYCDTLIMLATMDVTDTIEATIQETLRQLNELVASSRQLEQRRVSLLPILGSNVMGELSRERADLELRLAQTTDGAVRHSVEQSIQMCDARMENARAVESGLERLKAQQETIVHALSSVQTSIARMQLIAEPQAEIAAQELAETVAQINRQTVAVEQAVQEVVQLRY